MEHGIKKFIKDSFIYGMSKNVSMVISIFLIPIYTRVFMPADYGILDVIVTVCAIATIILRFGINEGVYAYYYRTEDEKDRKLTLSTGLIFSIVVSGLFLLAVTSFLAGPISGLVLRNPEYGNIIKIAIANVVVSIALRYIANIYRLRLEPMKFSAIFVTGLIIQTFLTIYFVVIAKMGIVGVFLGGLISNTVLMFAAFVFTRRYFSFSFSFEKAKMLLKYGIPLVPAMVSFWILKASDRYFLIYFSTLHNIGLYSIAVKLSSVFTIVFLSMQMGLLPFVFSIEKQENAKQIYSRILTVFALFTGTLALFLSIFSKEILSVFTQPQYVPAFKVVGVLVYSVICSGMFFILSIGAYLSHKTKYIGGFLALAAGLNLVFNTLLIPRFHIMGAAISTCLAQLIAIVFLYRKVQSFYRINYEIRRVIKIFSFSVLFVFAGSMVSIYDFSFSIVLKGIISCLFVFILFKANLLGAHETDYIKNFIFKTKKVLVGM